ncbi:MAG: hypothetical protein LC789_02730 [Actinobacteria bacterium]|nr:hypothetical protein [Actinomycetota bacterium]MCA1721738.1 hypothetical protein [Actinomycetota bacterium]
MTTSRARRRRGFSLLAAGAVLATAACGSTVQQSGGDGAVVADGGAGGAGSAGAGADGLGTAGAGGVLAPAADGSTPTGLAAGDPGFVPGTGSAGGSGSGATGVGGGSTSTGATGAGGTGTSGTGGPGTVADAGKQGPGVTAKEIFVGVRYSENLQQARKAFGADSVDSGNQKANAKAMIDEINARGGVAGRKLVPVYHADDSTSAETGDQLDQAACETFTRDNKIAVTISGGGPVFRACMDKAGVLRISGGGLIGADKKSFADQPSFVSLGDVSQDRMMAEWVRALQRQVYFSGWDANLGQAAPTKAKVGMLGWDFPDWVRPQDRVMRPALAAIGQPVDPKLVIRIQGTESNADAGRFAAEISSAVLRFRDAGVTHIIMLDSDGLITFTFTKNAENQNYFPRLGINTATGAQALYSAGLIPAKSLAGAAGLGWKPLLDLPFGEGPRYLNADKVKECLEIIRKRSGQTFNSTNAASVALVFCDVMFGVAEAYNRAGPVLNVATAVQGLESLRGSYRAAAAPKTFIGPGRHDGLENGFDMVWDAGCTCAKYKDNGHPIPAA